MPYPRADFAAGLLGGRILAVGGMRGFSAPTLDTPVPFSRIRPRSPFELPNSSTPWRLVSKGCGLTSIKRAAACGCCSRRATMLLLGWTRLAPERTETRCGRAMHSTLPAAHGLRAVVLPRRWTALLLESTALVVVALQRAPFSPSTMLLSSQAATPPRAQSGQSRRCPMTEAELGTHCRRLALLGLDSGLRRPPRVCLPLAG